MAPMTISSSHAPRLTFRRARLQIQVSGRWAMSTVANEVRNVPAAVRPIVEAAIRVVREVAPSAEEVSYGMAAPRSKSMVWKLARYRVDGENVVGVGTLTAHSMLYFYRGR